MPKSSKSAPGRKAAKAGPVPSKFVDRDLCAVNPLKEQFEPTPAFPVPQRYKMAGGA